MAEKVVTRFAPSPTGFMHMGNVRAALYEWLWARKNKGTFILRIEDTDKEREVEGSIDHILESLRWLGIDYDEGPGISNGPHAPYIQSERLDIYKKYAQILIDKGCAYPDPYTKEQLEEWRKQAEAEKRPFLYREHRPLTFGVWDGTQALRFKTPEIKSYTWHDAVYGDLSAGPEMLDDFILIKADGYPTYNFAHIVDDIEMGITIVMRGQEYIASTPKYLSVYEALGVRPPQYAYLPHILAPGGKKKLGKRDGAKDILEYRDEGYLPDALINFLALLGWNPGDEREVFTRAELVDAFDISRIQKAGAQMSLEKLDWINREHMKKLSSDEMEKNILAWLPENTRNPKIIPVIQDRISKWKDVKDMAEKGDLDLFFKRPRIEKEKLAFKDVSQEQTAENLRRAIENLDSVPEESFTEANVKAALMDVAEKLESRGEVLHPVRYALSGLDRSPDPFIIAFIIGKHETIERLTEAL